MRRKIILVSGFLMVAGILSCSRSLVNSDFDRDINFSNYRSYDWMTEPEQAGQNNIMRNTLFEKRLRTAVDGELQARGYQSQTDKPDFLIAYYITVMDKLEVSTNDLGYYPGYYGYGFWSRYYGLGYYPRSINVYQYQEGTLILDFVDPQKMQLVWRGWYTDMVDETGIKVEEVNKAVKQILALFPPKNGKNQIKPTRS